MCWTAFCACARKRGVQEAVLNLVRDSLHRGGKDGVQVMETNVERRETVVKEEGHTEEVKAGEAEAEAEAAEEVVGE